ncbi:peptidylprolyl isomerase [Paenibacillus sp. MMS18-CY102]|uniref:peptidylprolyl isomerase n=1 Tax=Paenibacillus sp. MMS18-CY102 TaxID=2682849 RepID=UPI0013667332|nr:peptidylprolyl isomerase [Paenibacillus sp. MMS18-CY102]MWC31122.1 peptidylprolyl isomerase [Paenibacillus sp. MMS18-CY102]
MNQTNRISTWKRSLLLVAAMLLVVSALAACGKKNEKDSGKESASGNGTVIATYKGGEVTEDEFTKYTTFYSLFDQSFAMYMQIPEAKEQYLKEYVGYRILFDRSSEDDKKNADTEVATFIKQYKEQLASNAEMKKTVDTAGLTEQDVSGFYKQIVTIRKYWERNVSDADIKAEYEKNTGNYNLVSVRHILIGTTDPSTGAEKRKDEEALKIAKEVKQKLDAGGDWKALANQYSDDEGSKGNGGLYENANPNSWVPEFKEAAVSQPVGTVGDPVKSQFGYHVMKVEKRESKKFEEIAEDVKTQVRTGAINTKMGDFMTKELPTLIEKINLPKAETPATDGAATGTDAGKDTGAGATDSSTEKKDETTAK